jgi:hypothetical protein
VRQRLLRSDVGELVTRTAAERTAAGGDEQASDVLDALASQGLRERGVLAVDRHDLAGLGRVGDELAADDERLLVGERERGSRVEGGERGLETDRSRHPVEDDVTRRARRLDGCLRTGHQPRDPVVTLGVAASLSLGVERELDILRRARLGDCHQRDLMLERLPGQQRRIVATGRQRDDLEAVGVGGNDLEGLGADRPRRTENGDTLPHVAILSHQWCLAYFTSERSRRRIPSASGMISQIVPVTANCAHSSPLSLRSPVNNGV